MYWDYYFLGIVLLPGLLLAIYAQAKVSSTYHKFSQVVAEIGKPAHEIARLFLDTAGLHNIQIVKIKGHLTDYYDHKNKIIALSESVYDSNSIAAIGVACHEVGHALQYQNDYLPIKARNIIIPVCNFANRMLWVLLFLGAIFFYTGFGLTFMWLGVGVFALSVVLNLVTLPVEYNASRRATELLASSSILTADEVDGTKKVLNAAALTYVASLVISILNLVRLLLTFLANKD